MSDQEITNRDELTSLASGDKGFIRDISDTTDGATGTDKWFTLSRLSSYLASLVQTLTNKTIDGDDNTLSDIAYSSIKSTSRTGSDVKLVTGTEGTASDLAVWNSDGDLVDGPTPPSGTILGTTDTQTQTNKRITKRVTTIVSSATPTINSDNCDVVTITALATAITSMTSSLSGTPTNFQSLIFRILDDGTGRAITWGASFQAMGVTLPTTTTANKVLTVGFLYDTADSKWGCVASVDES